MNPLKILLVDDSKSARYALRLQLQRHTMTVETADAAEPALEQIRKSPPDAIFMDHTMPGMSGFEALDILKASPSTAHIPVVMCTSHEDPEFISQAKKKGAFDVLSKATAPEKLGELLGRLSEAEASAKDVVVAAGATVAKDQADALTAREAGATLPDEELEERIRTLIAPILDDRLERLTADLIAKIDERVDARARASAEAVIEDVANRLADDLIAKTDERLVSGLNLQTERLQQRFGKIQSDQVQPSTDHLLEEKLPILLQGHLEEERKDLAQRVQQLVETSMDALANEPAFNHRVSDAIKATVTEHAEQVAKRQAAEISEAVAAEWTGTVTGLMGTQPPAGDDRLYLFSGGAALVGIVSAVVVFLLLS